MLNKSSIIYTDLNKKGYSGLIHHDFQKKKSKLLFKSKSQNEKIEINPINHFELMINQFSNELINPGNSSFDFERDLIYQAQVMDAARLSNKEQRLVRLDEIK